MLPRSSVYEIIGNELDVAVSTIDPAMRFRALPNVDSMRVLQIILLTEKAFGVEIPDDVTFRIDTVGEFEALVHGLCEEGASP